MSSGAAKVSSVKRSRARRPSVPSSPSATANTLASTTITFCPKVTHSCAKRHPATVTCRAALEDLLQSWLTRIGDQTAPKVFLERLVCACSALPQDPMSVVRHIFDLHTRHGAILAPLAPQYKCISRRGELHRGYRVGSRLAAATLTLTLVPAGSRDRRGRSRAATRTTVLFGGSQRSASSMAPRSKPRIPPPLGQNLTEILLQRRRCGHPDVPVVHHTEQLDRQLLEAHVVLPGQSHQPRDHLNRKRKRGSGRGRGALRPARGQ